MHKKKNKIIAPDFLNNDKSTYNRATYNTDKKHIYSSIVTVFFIFLVGVGANYMRVNAENAAPFSSAPKTIAQKTVGNVENYNNKINEIAVIAPYDGNSVEIVDNNFVCKKDDHVLQWQKGKNQWECVRTLDIVFGDLDKSDVVVSSAGTIQCENNGEVLFWNTKKDYWSCGVLGDGISADLTDSADVEIEGTPKANQVLVFDGTKWINEDVSNIFQSESVEMITVNNVSAEYLSVTNVTTLAQTDITGPFTVTGDTIVTGNFDITGTTTLSGPTTLNGTTTIFDSVTNTSTVTGVSTLAQTDITGPFTVTGDTTLTGTTTVVGDVDISGTMTIGDYTLPNVDGTSGQVFKTDGSGNVAWADNTFLTLTDTPSSYTTGGILYMSSSGVLEDASDFFWDDSNDRLGIGTSNPQAELHIVGHAYQSLPTGATFFGYQAGENDDLTGIGDNTFFGYQAGQDNVTGVWNAGFGHRALSNNTNSRNAAFGDAAMGNNTTGRENAAVGYAAMANGSGGATGNAVLGSGAMAHGDGYMYNVAVGSDTLYSTNGSYNVAVGNEALRNIKTSNNTAVGNQALRNATAINGNGQVTQWEDVGGGYVRATDSSHGLSNGETVVIEGNDEYEGTYVISGVTTNTFNFVHSWEGDTELADWRIYGQGENNTALGYQAGLGSYGSSRGSNNLFLGYQAGDNYTTGNNNIVIGYDVDVQNPANSNQLSIGNLIFGNGIDGNGTSVSSGNIGIGEENPSHKLDVDGAGRFSDVLTVGGYTLPSVDGANGQVLKTNGSGNLAWSGDDGASTFLSLTDTMNSYTNGSILFTSASGVTQDVNALFWNSTNNRLGIGTGTPSQALDVNGNVTASRYYDRNSTAFYIDPASTSYVNDMRASILYDRDNTSYYINPASAATAAKLAGAIELGSNTSIYESSTTTYFDNSAYGDFLFRNSGSSLPVASIRLDDGTGVVASLGGDFGDGSLGLNSWSSGGSQDIYLEGGDEQNNYITEGITIGGTFGEPHSTGNTPNTNANLARVHIKGQTIEYDILPIQTCPAGWTNIGSVGGGGAIDCQQIASLIVENGRAGFGTKYPSYQLHVQGTAYATGAAGALSDIRHKSNISQIERSLETILNLNPVSYEWIDPLDDGMQGLQMGFIAQDVEKIAPSIVLTQDDEGHTKGLKYTEFIPLTVGAIQEQNNLIATNTNDLATKATATTVLELQSLVNEQFESASNMLDQVDVDMIALQGKANLLSDNLDALSVHMDAVDAGLKILDLLGATELTALEDLIAIDAEKLVYIDEDAGITIEGIVTAQKIIAKEIETHKFTISDAVTEEDEDGEDINASSVGTVVIAEGEAISDAIETTVITEDSRVFAIARNADKAVAIQVKDIREGSFVLEIDEEAEKDIEIDWFVVSAKD